MTKEMFITCLCHVIVVVFTKIAIQETKLSKTSKTPFIEGYAASRLDRTNAGGGLLLYINNGLNFSQHCIPTNLKLTHLSIPDLWYNPVECAALLSSWESRMPAP